MVFRNLDFKNRSQNEFGDNNKKSAAHQEKRVSHEIDSKDVWPDESIPPAWELNNIQADIVMNKGCYGSWPSF